MGGAGKDGQFRRSVSRRHDRGSERSAASNLMRLIDTAIAVDEPSRMASGTPVEAWNRPMWMMTAPTRLPDDSAWMPDGSPADYPFAPRVRSRSNAGKDAPAADLVRS